ncbi:MAG: SMP-30/gluconolactonase/LRE family protein [Sphingomonadaceae bacterium]
MRKLLENGYFFEGARWHQGFWWVSDLYAGEVLRVSPEGERKVVANVAAQPSGLGWLPDGNMLIVSMCDMRILRLGTDGVLREHADLAPHVGGWTNDMVVDRNGYAYVSNLGFNMWINEKPTPAKLSCIAPDGVISTVADDLLFPNGMVVSPDGTTLIVAETFGNRLSAFTIGEKGSLSNRRVFAEFGPPPSWGSVADFVKEDFAPDGCAIDAEGCVWVADALFNRVCRVADGGEILQEIRTPDNWGIYSCALGGVDGRSLLICSAPDYDQDKRKAKAEAVLFVQTVDVPAAG